MAGQLCVADMGGMGASAMRPTVGTGDGGRRGTTATAEGSVGLRLIVGGSVGGTAGTAVTVVAIVAVGALVVAIIAVVARMGRRREIGEVVAQLRQHGGVHD